MNTQENDVSLFYSPLSGRNEQPAEEVLVADTRHGQSPAQAVEGKLVSMLQDGQLLMSHLQARRERCPSA